MRGRIPLKDQRDYYFAKRIINEMRERNEKPHDLKLQNCNTSFCKKQHSGTGKIFRLKDMEAEECGAAKGYDVRSNFENYYNGNKVPTCRGNGH